MLGIFRQVERRHSNYTKSGDGLTCNVYQVMVTRLVLLWVTIWTHETEYN
jgi:hypothetical protein